MLGSLRKGFAYMLAMLLILSTFHGGWLLYHPAEALAAEAGGYDGRYDAYGVTDVIDLGDPASEQAHKLIASDSQAVVGEEGETARVSLPKSTPDYFGGDITFTVKVDPNDQNYFTLKLWGSDKTEYRAFLAIDNQVFYPAPLVIAKMAEEPPIENRFYFSTVPIPLEKSKGKSELTITIRTASTYYPYSAGTFSKAYQEKVVTPSNKYYTGYVHTTASLATEVIKQSGKLTSYIPPVRSNGANGSDLDPGSIVAGNMRNKLLNDVKAVMQGVIDRNASTNNFTTATWNHSENAHGNGTMLLPYSQNDVNLYNLKYVTEVLLDQDSPEYDALLKQLGVDQLLDAVLGAMDRLVINYLNRPGTIQTGGHQSSWGGYYQGLGEALWNVSKLFENGRYEQLGGTKYTGFDAWYRGAEKVNWLDKFRSVARFYHQPEAGTAFPFLIEKAAEDLGAEPYITTRRAAYEEILWLNFNYARTHAYTLTPLTNQVMFQMFGAWRSNAGLLAIQSAYAENYKSSLRQLYRSTGILPYYDIDMVNGLVEAETKNGGDYSGKLIVNNLAAFNDSTQYDADRNYIGPYRKAWGEEYYMTTEFGLTRETTYVAGYGEHSDYLVHAWRLVRDTPEAFQQAPGIKLKEENELLRKALLVSNARAHMKYADVDDGYRSMRLEATIEARGPFYPYDAGYHVHMKSGGTTTINPFIFAYLKAELEKDPGKYQAYFGPEYSKFFGYAVDAVGYTQQMLADNHLTPFIGSSFASDLKSLAGYKYVTNHPRVAKLIPSTNLSWFSAEELAAVKHAGFDENALYGSSFYDIEDSIVYFRDKDSVYLLAFEYKSDSGLNGVSRMHAVSSDYDRIAMVDHEVQYTPSGFWNFGAPDTTVAYNTTYDPVTGMPDGSTNMNQGEIYPVAAWHGYDDRIALTPYKAGSPYGGYGEFYSVQYGPYIIAMNTTRDSYRNSKPYEITLPSGYTKDMIYDKLSHQSLPVTGGKVTVPAFSAVVLDLESELIVNDIPSAPIFATGTAANGKAALTWTHSAGVDAGYQILRSTSKDGAYAVIATVDANTNLYLDDTVANGSTYYYKVRGVNAHGRAGSDSPYAKVPVSANALIENWSFDTTAWSLDKQITTVQGLQAAMKSGTITFTGSKDTSGNLLFAYTSNLLTGAADSTAAPKSGSFEMVAEIQSGEDIGILFKESLDVKSRGGLLTIDSEGNYKFVYRQQPNIVKDFDMRVDGYSIFNNLNPVAVTGRVEGAKWLKVARKGLYVYAYVSKDGVDWQPIGHIGYPLYPEVSATGEYYFMDNNWHHMKTPGEFYLPMADTIYVGVASSGPGTAAHVSLTALDADNSLPGQVTPTILSDSVNGRITIGWKHVLKASYYQVYRTRDALTADHDPTAVGTGWELVGSRVKDIVFADTDFKTGSGGPVYYKVVAFNEQDLAGPASQVLIGEIQLDGVEYPASVWSSVDINTPSAGYDLMSGSQLSIYTDGKRFWNTDGNSFRFVYQEIPAKTAGTFITRVDKSSIIGEHLGEALIVKNNVNKSYDSGTYHRSIRMNTTRGLFASGQQSGWSSNFGTNNTVDNQDAWLRLDTNQGSENIDVYYAPVTDKTKYPSADQWIKLLTFSPDSPVTGNSFWRNMDTGTNGKWYVGLALATGGNMGGSSFYNVAPLFNLPAVTIQGKDVTPTKQITVQKGTPIKLKLSAKDAFGSGDLPVTDIEAIGTLPDGAVYQPATGELTWTPSMAGAYKLPFRIQDKASLNDFYGGLDVHITVMDSTIVPVFDPIADKSYSAGKTIALTAKATVKNIATGADGTPSPAAVAYRLKSVKDSYGNELDAAELGITLDSATGAFNWTPTRLHTGVYDLVFSAEAEGSVSDKSVKFIIMGAPLFEIAEPYRTAIANGETIEVTGTEKLLLPIVIKDPTGTAFYSYKEEIPAGAVYSENLFDWTPTYAQSLAPDPTYTLKLVAYNAGFKNEVAVKFKVKTPAPTAPLLTQNWQAGALSQDSLSKMKVSYGGLGNSEVTINNASHYVSPNYNQGTGRSTFVYQPLTSNAEIVARITSYGAPSKFAGVMISDYYAPNPAETGINKLADTTFMALSASEYSLSNTQSGRFKTDSVLAFARNSNPANGDWPNLGFATGEKDLTATYWVRLTYKVNPDGSATVRGSYRIDGDTAWIENENWMFTYTAAQVAKGLYGGLMASPANKEVKFDHARMTFEAPLTKTNVGALTSIKVKSEHAYDQVVYTYSLTKDGKSYTDATISSGGVFNWGPVEGGATYYLTVTATAKETNQATIQNYVIEVAHIDKAYLQQAISEAKAYTNAEGKYSARSFQKLTQAIAQAEAAMPDIQTYAALDAEVAALNGAVSALVDVTPLKTKLASAKAISNDAGQYTQASYARLLQAIAAGDNMVDSADTLQQLQAALAELNEAVDGLRTPGVSLSGPSVAAAGKEIVLIYSLNEVTSQVYAKSMTVHYNPELLEYVKAVSLVNEFTVIASTYGGGKVTFVEAGLGKAVTGTMDLLELHFRALPGSSASAVTTVYLTGVLAANESGQEMTLNAGQPHEVEITNPDAAPLLAEIDKAQAAVNAARVDERLWGHFKEPVIQALKEAIQAAQAVAEQAVRQPELDQAMTDLSKALETFKGSVNARRGIGDVAWMARYYGTLRSDSDWTFIYMYDLDENGKIDIADLAAFARDMLH
ncbi:cohesin domain-containing protein [Paenibacillus puerhi]|uniref:cohesin domain-containing protein n=1 Tax=Paenibacillus puerhi TaxID=2692622 RepID=UPI0013569C84|nr:cohesin domain-containing protein [Paenibacillus puerhi]